MFGRRTRQQELDDGGRRQLRDAYRATFSSPEGRRVLEDIQTSLKLVQNVYTRGMDALELAFHEGRRSAAVHIETMMEEHHE
ncbi:hypothetical protein [Nitratidesulfovibrio termitidis]|uniref:Bbp19 family protein n=1 Tax=Nitratidesulfovibrio termitidis TaxID=42252 RepID=UPI00054EA37C|nr:hypothetical protein [Nitratidesulfovibrio termitidis]